MIGDLVTRLIDAGCPPDVAAATVAEAFAMGAKSSDSPPTSADIRRHPPTSADSRTTSALENRRAYDRERMRRKRAASAKSSDSPPTSADIRRQSAKSADSRTTSADSPPTSADIRRQSANDTLTYSLHKEESIKEERKKVRAPKKKSADLSDDWQPSEVHFAKAAALGVSRDAVLSKAEDMRLWARSTGARKVDWDATFHGFIRRDAEKLKANGNGKTGNVIAAADRLLERVRAFDERPGGIRDGTGAGVVRLFSEG